MTIANLLQKKTQTEVGGEDQLNIGKTENSSECGSDKENREIAVEKQ